MKDPVTTEDLLRDNIKQLSEDLCRSFVRIKELGDRVKELEQELKDAKRKDIE